MQILVFMQRPILRPEFFSPETHRVTSRDPLDSPTADKASQALPGLDQGARGEEGGLTSCTRQECLARQQNNISSA